MINNQYNKTISQTTELLKLLNTEEFKKFRGACGQSKFFGSERIEALYMAVRRYYPAFDMSPTDIRKVYGKVFPQKKFSAYRLEKIFEGLKDTCEAYLLWLELEKDAVFREKTTALTMAQRPLLFDLFKKSLKSAHAANEQREKGTATDFYYLQSELYDLLYADKQHNKYDIHDTTLNNLNDACDRFFASFMILSKQSNEHRSHFADEVIKNTPINHLKSQ